MQESVDALFLLKITGCKKQQGALWILNSTVRLFNALRPVRGSSQQALSNIAVRSARGTRGFCRSRQFRWTGRDRQFSGFPAADFLFCIRRKRAESRRRARCMPGQAWFGHRHCGRKFAGYNLRKQNGCKGWTPSAGKGSTAFQRARPEKWRFPDL